MLLKYGYKCRESIRVCIVLSLVVHKRPKVLQMEKKSFNPDSSSTSAQLANHDKCSD